MVAVVHSLSMYTRPVGHAAATALAVAGAATSVRFSNLAASTAYRIDWGEGSPDTAVTSSSGGVVTSTHTFADAGLFTITLRNSANTATLGTTTAYVSGAISFSSTLTHAVSKTFTFIFGPNTTYSVNWGDGTTDSITTSAGTNERQTLTVTGSPTGGTFIPTINGSPTAAVDYNSSVSAFQAKVDAVAALKGNVTVGGTPGVWTLDYVDDFANTNVSTTTIDATGLTGGTSPGVSVATNTSGAAAGTTTLAHTYASAASYTITVKDLRYNETVGTLAVTAA